MMELYWITRLDDLKFMLIMLILCCIVRFLFAGISYVCDEKDLLKWKYIKASVIIAFALLFANTLIPSTKDALLIYGLSGTIEYIKENDKAKELPDKAIEALDMCLEIVTKDNKEEESK